MPEWSVVKPTHVRAAIEECDRLGAKEFLARHGFGRARIYQLWHHGNEYDSKAILGVAYLHATGRALSSGEFSGGESGAAKVLIDLGFDVVAQEQPATSTRPRKASPAKPRSAKKPEPVVNLCPRCFVAIPASGVCDFCD